METACIAETKGTLVLCVLLVGMSFVVKLVYIEFGCANRKMFQAEGFTLSDPEASNNINICWRRKILRYFVNQAIAQSGSPMSRFQFCMLRNGNSFATMDLQKLSVLYIAMTTLGDML